MRKEFDSIIFDMDGVLVDESRSYRLAIEMTVNNFLAKNGTKTKITQEDVRIIKSFPGFNNDWDVSFVLIDLIQRGKDKQNYSDDIRLVTPSRRKTKKYLGIKDIFQSYYLGEKLFKEIYNRPPVIFYARGLNLNDSLLIDEVLLTALAGKYKLGIATSRPRLEALFTARNLKITPQLIKEEFIVAKEDAAREKPEPDPLLEVKKRMGVLTPIYIGDTINDVIAAQKAGMPSIFIGEKNLGDYQFTNVNKIQEIIL